MAMSTSRRHDRRTRRQARFHLEPLDDWLVLSVGAGVAVTQATVHHRMASHAHHASSHTRHGANHARHTANHTGQAANHTGQAVNHTGQANLGATGRESPGPGSSGTLPANVVAALQSLYQEYESQGGGARFTPSQPSDKLLQISGTSVAVSLKLGAGSDFEAALAQLRSDGMQVSASSPTYGLIEGLLPIAVLPAAAQVAASVTTAPPPILR
jgi:hypothetical protein